MTTAEVNSASRPSTLPRRLIALGVFVPTLGVLLVAVALQPDPSGHGTHEQLGLAPCALKQRTGVPCPSCGMTTACTHAVRGAWWTAVKTQPAGAALALLCAMAAIVSAYALLTGRPVERHLHWLWRPAILWGAVVLFLAAWAYRLIVDIGDYT